MEKNRIFFVDENDPEFTAMFKHFPDPQMYNSLYGESLQYMGTVIGPSERIRHQFRHRAIPGTNERKYWEIQCTVKFLKRVLAGEFDDKMF